MDSEPLRRRFLRSFRPSQYLNHVFISTYVRNVCYPQVSSPKDLEWQQSTRARQAPLTRLSKGPAPRRRGGASGGGIMTWADDQSVEPAVWRRVPHTPPPFPGWRDRADPAASLDGGRVWEIRTTSFRAAQPPAATSRGPVGRHLG